MPKILIAEDEVSLLTVLKERFLQEKFEVVTARDGAEALALAVRERPNIILLDIKMPVMDGLTMLKKLRPLEKGTQTPVILLTNYDLPENVASALEEHAFDFLVKSNEDLDSIVKTVNKKLTARSGK